MTCLAIVEIDTKDVSQEEDGLVLGVIAGGRCDVGPDAIDDLDFTC